MGKEKSCEKDSERKKFLLLDPVQAKNTLYISNAHDIQKSVFHPAMDRFFAVTVLLCALLLRDVERSSTFRIQNSPLNR